MKGNRDGFTLIELLVVITIMSILTIITVGQFETARKKARDVQRKADLNSLSKSLQMYYADYGVFPPALAGPLDIGTDSNWGKEFKDTSGYVYMKVLPKEVTLASSHPFCYAVSIDFKKFALYAQLENANDIECDKDGEDGVEPDEDRKCNSVDYCYYVVSQNTILNADDTFQ